ncbi:MAG: hypothetical protein HFH68_17645 [Lachnospiraceae bacterium]|nr:hypothetical protein [Lachnospiraceae bacterium]
MEGKFEKLFFNDKEKYAVVIAFFDWIIRSDFKHILNTLAEDTSYGDEVLGCNLPSLFDSEDEDGYFDDGVEFYLNDIDIKIDFQMYIKCLELACKIYIEENGDDKEVKSNLLIIQRRYS